MDIMSLFQPPDRRYYAFLSLTFGLIANLDIGTESLRSASFPIRCGRSHVSHIEASKHQLSYRQIAHKFQQSTGLHVGCSMPAGHRGGPGCRWMGASRFQVGAVREILRRSEHIANIAILPSAAAAASQRAGTSDAGAAAPMTPILDGLGNLAELAPVSSAALPEVGFPGSRRHAACMLANL